MFLIEDKPRRPHRQQRFEDKGIKVVHCHDNDEFDDPMEISDYNDDTSEDVEVVEIQKSPTDDDDEDSSDNDPQSSFLKEMVSPRSNNKRSKQSRLKKTIKCKSSTRLKTGSRYHQSKRPLSGLITSLYAHTPCGPDNPGGTSRSCWQKSCCEKNMPKVQVDKTDATIDGYPYYRRRTLLTPNSKYEMPYKTKLWGITDKKTKKRVTFEPKVTNIWIPGYNPSLSMKHRYHINVECCHGMTSMTYLFHYIHKGTDVGYIEMKEYQKDQNEIKLYKYCRVLSADEAHWEISGYKSSELEPSVRRMGFYLPDQVPVNLHVKKVPSESNNKKQRNQTQYYSFFERNRMEYKIAKKYKTMVRRKKDPEVIVKTINQKLGYKMFYVEDGKVERFFDYQFAETEEHRTERLRKGEEEKKLPWSFELTYPEFGKRYTWTKQKNWTRYKVLIDKVTRLYISYPGSDHFYLRMLLKFRKGMKYPEDLLLGPEGNMRYPNHKLACLAHGLINNSTEYYVAMHEAYQLGCYGRQLLKFFGQIIKEGDATNIREIWDGCDQTSSHLTDEEQKYPKGMKHLMMILPKRYFKKYKKYHSVPDNLKYVVEQHTLRQLAFFLEQEGVDYPEELPVLDDENKHQLTEEYIHAHRRDPDKSTRRYDEHLASTTYSFFLVVTLH